MKRRKEPRDYMRSPLDVTGEPADVLWGMVLGAGVLALFGVVALLLRFVWGVGAK